MKRKVLSIILACTMLFGAVASTFAVSAAEVDTSLPPSVTQEDMTVAASKIDSTLTGLIGMENLLTNQTVSQITTMLAGVLEGTGIISLSPATLWENLIYLDNNPLNPYCNEESWDNVDIASLDWGVIPGDADTFVDAVRTLFTPFAQILALLCMDQPGQNPPESPTIDPEMPIPTPLYRFVLYPIYEAFGVEGVQEPVAWSARVMELISTGAMSPTNLITQAKRAFTEGDMDTFNTLVDQAREAAQEFKQVNLELINMVAEPILNLVRDLLKAPVTTLLDKMPNLENVLQTVDLSWVWGLLAPDMTETPNSMVGVLNTVLGMIDINGTKLGITLPEYDFTAWKDLDTTERLTAFMNYAVEVIRAEGNTEAITALIPADMQGLVSSVLELDDNSIKHFLVNYIAYGKLDFGPGETTTAPTDETTTKASGSDDTTAPAETTTGGGTAGGDNSQPDTGDTALAAVAFTTLLAAGACAVLLKKKSSK